MSFIPMVESLSYSFRFLPHLILSMRIIQTVLIFIHGESQQVFLPQLHKLEFHSLILVSLGLIIEFYLQLLTRVNHNTQCI
jgi:hypothetical protein